MPQQPTPRSVAIRSAIETYFRNWLEEKGKTPKDSTSEPATIPEPLDFDRLIRTAADRHVWQIQRVTHALKGGHPDAVGTSLYANPEALSAHELVGTHSMSPGELSQDLVGHLPSRYVGDLLNITVEGQTLRDLLAAGDPDVLSALCADKAQSQSWATAFASIHQSRGAASTHTRAKQVYWLVGESPTEDAAYHLLAPLYPSSLAHHVFSVIKADYFNDEAKVARKARQHKEYSEREIHEYPQLAVQKLGGSKPQNISQLNSKQRGTNYLLASLPPLWAHTAVRPPFHTDSVFPRLARRESVKALVRQLKRFLESDPPRNKATRDQRDTLVAAVIDELFQFEQELRLLAPGWSSDARCRLPDAERFWLDPWRSDDDADFAEQRTRLDWPEQLCRRFANWLNDALSDKLLFDDTSYGHWYGLLQAEFRARQREGLIDA